VKYSQQALTAKMCVLGLDSKPLGADRHVGTEHETQWGNKASSNGSEPYRSKQQGDG